MAEIEVKDFKDEDMIEDGSEEPQEEAHKEEKKEHHAHHHEEGRHAERHGKHNKHKAFSHKKAHGHESHEHHEESTIKIKKSTLKSIFIGIAIIALIALAVFAAVKIWPLLAGDRLKVEFYVMSQCPYGTQVEDAIAPVLDKMGDKFDFSLDFIANDNGDGTFASLHGQNEVLGNIVQLCAIKYEPENYMDMIVCMNKAASSIPGNWEQCSVDSGLDTEKIKSCYDN